MKCPRCKSENNFKNGIVRGNQRYKCKDCGYNYTFDYSYFAEKERKRRFGLSMYLEGFNMKTVECKSCNSNELGQEIRF